MSLRNHVVAVRALAAGVLIWIAVQIGQGLWLGEWRYALSGVVGGLLWLTLVVVLPPAQQHCFGLPKLRVQLWHPYSA